MLGCPAGYGRISGPHSMIVYHDVSKIDSYAASQSSSADRARVGLQLQLVSWRNRVRIFFRATQNVSRLLAAGTEAAVRGCAEEDPSPDLLQHHEGRQPAASS